MASPNASTTSDGSGSRLRAPRYIDLSTRELLAAVAPGARLDITSFLLSGQVVANAPGSQSPFHYYANRDVQLEIAANGVSTDVYMTGTFNGATDTRMRRTNVSTAGVALTSFGAFDTVTAIYQKVGATAIGADVRVISGKVLCSGALFLYMPAGGSVTGHWVGGEKVLSTAQPDDTHMTVPSLGVGEHPMEIDEISAITNTSNQVWY